MVDAVTHLLRTGRKAARLALGVRSRWPREVQVEVTNRCNLDCGMCPRRSVLGVPEVDMSRETFAAVLGRLRSPEAITLTGWGEPLMHPELLELLDLAAARFPGAALAFTTNGHLLTERVAERVLERPLRRVTVSLEELPWDDEPAGEPPGPGHGPSPKAARNVRAFLARRRALAAAGRRVPEARLQVVLFPGSQATLLRLVDFAAEAGFDVVNLVRLDVRGRPDLARPTWEEERRLIAAARRRARSRGVALAAVNDHGPFLRLASRGDRFCVRLDSFVYVDVAGRVAPCCLLRDHHLGDLRRQTLAEVWASPEARRFHGPRPHPACDGCDAFRRCYAPVARPAEVAS